MVLRAPVRNDEKKGTGVTKVFSLRSKIKINLSCTADWETFLPVLNENMLRPICVIRVVVLCGPTLANKHTKEVFGLGYDHLHIYLCIVLKRNALIKKKKKSLTFSSTNHKTVTNLLSKFNNWSTNDSAGVRFVSV